MSNGRNDKKEMSTAQKNELIRRKALQQQLGKVYKMSLQQILQYKRKQTSKIPQDQTKVYLARSINMHLDDPERYQYDLETPGQKHADLLKQTDIMKQQIRKDNKFSPNWSLLKRGKLGVDAFLIAFGILGTFLLPIFFYQLFKKNKERIVNSRSIKPELIKYIDEESQVTIDSVSQQSIHYLNPERQAIAQKHLQRVRQIQNLKRDLDL